MTVQVAESSSSGKPAGAVDVDMEGGGEKNVDQVEEEEDKIKDYEMPW